MAAIQANRALEVAAAGSSASGESGHVISSAATGHKSASTHTHTQQQLRGSVQDKSLGGPGERHRQRRFTTSSASGGDTALKFVDRDEHVYFWFPLLAGLSELTFDPRDQIRNSALEVLFDTLKAHGGTFAASFWRRVFDSVLMPIFDHVRAEVTDTTTFTSEKKREKEDYWLYETCQRCLQHLIDVFVLFYDETQDLLLSVLQLLSSFINRTHQSLAAGGVYALTHLTNSAAPKLGSDAWLAITTFMYTIAQETSPNLLELVTPPSRTQTSTLSQQQQQVAQLQSSSAAAAAAPVPPTQQQAAAEEEHPADNSSTVTATVSGTSQPPPPTNANGWNPSQSTSTNGPVYSLREGIGARRLARFRSQASVQLLLVQSGSDVYVKQCKHMPSASVTNVMQTLDWIASHARKTDSDTTLRKRLAMQQAEDKVPDDRVIYDPPLLRLETDAAHGYLSVLMHVYAYSSDPGLRSEAASRMVALCQATLMRFALGKDPARVQPDSQYMADARVKHQQLQAAATARAAGAHGNGAGGIIGGLQQGSVNIGGVNIVHTKSAETQRRAAQYAAAVAAATQGRTADNKSIIIGRTSTGLLVLMAAPSVEYAPFTPLINSTLAALAAFDDATFQTHLHEFFPLMTALIGADYAPADVLRTLADLFAKRVGPILGVARAEAAAEMAAAAAEARQQVEQQQKSLQQPLPPPAVSQHLPRQPPQPLLPVHNVNVA